jgi:D-tagatose-1,6-bisphosphate aldolase subunit GatZ/KbaZ
MFNLLDEIIRAQKEGEERGIASICSAHPWVLKAAMRGNGSLLIESTCNQVNQFGGYTGMTPDAFVAYLHYLAAETGFPVGQLILGGDHLGPSVWQNEPAASAMQKSEDMVRTYVQAGYTKIHLDASMKLGDDNPSHPLDVELVARRTAWLAKAAESTYSDPGPDCKLRYVIGTEVPLPGGAIVHEVDVSVTKVEDVCRMLEVTRAAFFSEGLEAAWDRVIALVVQPGVEFGDDFVLDYNPGVMCDLVRFVETTPFVYEAHSTDYQTSDNLRNLVRDHFAILKVGPALTFAFREAVFALAMMENELMPPEQRSRLIERLDEAMQLEPVYWNNHYRGTEREIAFARKYSLSDRVRYYWAQPDVQSALNLLLKNFGEKPLPLSLLSQYFPRQYTRIREGRLGNSVKPIVTESVFVVLRDYIQACEPVPGIA